MSSGNYEATDILTAASSFNCTYVERKRFHHYDDILSVMRVSVLPMSRANRSHGCLHQNDVKFRFYLCRGQTMVSELFRKLEIRFHLYLCREQTSCALSSIDNATSFQLYLCRGQTHCNQDIASAHWQFNHLHRCSVMQKGPASTIFFSCQ